MVPPLAELARTELERTFELQLPGAPLREKLLQLGDEPFIPLLALDLPEGILHDLEELERTQRLREEAMHTGEVHGIAQIAHFVRRGHEDASGPRLQTPTLA